MMNMSRVSKFISVVAIAFAAMSCGGSKENTADKANIDGVLAGAPSSEVVLSVLELDQISVLDTLMTDEAGKFSYEVEVSEGDPEFVYVYADGRKIASLIVDAGDKVSFTVAEDGEVAIEGSEESVKLIQVEREHAQMNALFASLAAELETATGAKAQQLTEQMGKEYRGLWD